MLFRYYKGTLYINCKSSRVLILNLIFTFVLLFKLSGTELQGTFHTVSNVRPVFDIDSAIF